MTINFNKYLEQEWVPALGCTEPASIALAAATAAENLGRPAERARLVVDSKIYKNCYAVGIPHSGHKTGILWAAAIGANLKDTSLGLECFRSVSGDIVASAQKLIDTNAVTVDVDASKSELYIDCSLEAGGKKSRAVIAHDHTNFVFIEAGGKVILDKQVAKSSEKSSMRGALAGMSIGELVQLAKSIDDTSIARLKEGIDLNVKIARHGLKLFPKRFVELAGNDSLSRISKLVCAGVYARMSGEDLPVMSLAGSGNKGIVASVPIALHSEDAGSDERATFESLALACLVTSATTHRLGTLSAVCGCSNAAGIGLAAGLVHLEGGGEKEISLAINNMVGNLSGMICDGAKIGCALKTMTSVDAAFRSSALALSGVGIPASDGIVGTTGEASLANLGKLATQGMISTDKEILAIMKEKLRKS